MQNDSVIEPYGVPEIFVDGFTQHSTRDGVMTCLGYRKLKDGRTAVVRLTWPVVNTEAAISDARVAMAEPSPAASDVSDSPRKRAH